MNEPHSLYFILDEMGDALTALSRKAYRRNNEYIRTWKEQLRNLEEGFIFDNRMGYNPSGEYCKSPFFIQVLQLQHDLSLLTHWEKSGYPSRKRRTNQMPLQLMNLRLLDSDISLDDEPTRKAIKKLARTQRPSLPIASKHLPSPFWRKIIGYTGHWEMLKTTLFTALNAEFLREPGKKPLTHRMTHEIDPSVTLDALLEKLAANLDRPIEGELFNITNQGRRLRLIDGAIQKGKIRQPCTLWIILLEAYQSRLKAIQYNSREGDTDKRYSHTRLFGFLKEIQQKGITGAIRTNDERAYITEMFKALLGQTLHQLPPVFLFRILTNSPIELRKRLPELWDIPRVIDCIEAGFKRGEIGNIHFKDFRSYFGLQPYFNKYALTSDDFERESLPMLCRLPKKPSDLDRGILYAFRSFLEKKNVTLLDIENASEYAEMSGQVLKYLKNTLSQPREHAIRPLVHGLISLLEAEQNRSTGILSILSSLNVNSFFSESTPGYVDSIKSPYWREDTVYQTYSLLFSCTLDRDLEEAPPPDTDTLRNLPQTLSWIGYLKEYDFDFLRHDGETFIWKTALFEQLFCVNEDYWDNRDDNESLCQSRSCDYSSRHFQKHRLYLLQRFQVVQLLMQEGLYLEPSDVETIHAVLESLTDSLIDKQSLVRLHDDYRFEFSKMLQLVCSVGSNLQWTQFNLLRRNIESKTRRLTQGDFSASFPRLEYFLNTIVSLPVEGHRSGLPLKIVTNLLDRLMKSTITVGVDKSTMPFLTHCFPETAILTKDQNDQIVEALTTYIFERFRQRLTADEHTLPSARSEASDLTIQTISPQNTLLHAHSKKDQPKRRVSDLSKPSHNPRCRASRRSSRFCC